MSESPQQPFKSEQYEFNAEQNRTIGDLAASMQTVATLMKLAALVFLVLLGLHVYQNTQASIGYAPVVGYGVGVLLCGAIGFWTGSSAHSFTRIVESQNKDVWHLMNALTSLKDMYALLRLIVMGSLVLLVVAIVVHFVNQPG